MSKTLFDAIELALSAPQLREMSPFYGYCVGSAMAARAKGDLDVGNYMDQLAEYSEDHCVHPNDRRLTHTELLEISVLHLDDAQQARLLGALRLTLNPRNLSEPTRTALLVAAYRLASGDMEA
jgi:hypothetical protein